MLCGSHFNFLVERVWEGSIDNERIAEEIPLLKNELPDSRERIHGSDRDT
jgi:hypothetical protein